MQMYLLLLPDSKGTSIYFCYLIVNEYLLLYYLIDHTGKDTSIYFFAGCVPVITHPKVVCSTLVLDPTLPYIVDIHRDLK